MAFRLVLLIRGDAETFHRTGDILGSIDADSVSGKGIESARHIIGTDHTARRELQYAFGLVLGDLGHVKLRAIFRQSENIHS